MAGYVKALADFHDVTKAFKDNEIGDIMEKAHKKEIAWELNVPAIFGDHDFFKRYFQIGREVGVVFNLGTDGHALENVDTKKFTEELKRILY